MSSPDALDPVPKKTPVSVIVDLDFARHRLWGATIAIKDAASEVDGRQRETMISIVASLDEVIKRLDSVDSTP